MNKTRIYRQVFWVICGLMFCLSLPKMGINAETNEVKQLTRTQEEIGEMRNEHCKGFRNSDGSASIVISSMPVHFQDETGKWSEINTSLEDSSQDADENGQKYGFRNRSNTLESYLPQNSNGWTQLRSGKSRLSFRLVNENKKKFQKKGSDTIISYDALPKCDISMAVKNAALKEDLILRDRTAPKQFEYQMILHNLEAVKTADDAILFKDKQDKPVFIMPKMVMWDSNQAVSEEIATVLTRQGDKYRLTVKPNLKWLMDPKRKYPITVDPTTIRITGAGSDPSKGVGTLVYYLPGIDFINGATSEVNYSKTLSSGTFDINKYSDVRADYFPFDVSYTVTATSQGTSAPYWSSSGGAVFKIDAWNPAATSNADSNVLSNIYTYSFPNAGGSRTVTYTLKKGEAVRFKINNVNFYRAFGTNPWSCNVSMTITCQRETMSPPPPVITQLAPENYERTTTLNWTAPTDSVNVDPVTGQPYPNFTSAGIKEYIVQRSTSSDFTQNITEVHVADPTTSHTFNDLIGGTTYFFRCYAVDGDGNPTDTNHSWNSVSYPSGIRWSAITKTKCIAATVKPLDQSGPAISNITPANLRGSGYFGLNRNPNVSFTIPNMTARPFVKVAAGWYHSLALNADETVCSWGANTNGQLGDGTTAVQKFPVRVTTSNGQPLTNIIAIGGGQNHSLALKRDGTVWTWGANGSGQLGNGTTTQSLLPVQVMLNATTPLTGVIAISCGSLSSYALKNDGTVWAWGEDGSRQLGDGGTTDQKYAVQMKVNTVPITNVIAIAAGASHVLALKNDGSVWAGGLNSSGQLGCASTSAQTTVVQAAAIGVTPYLSGVSAIAAGGNFSMALKYDGTLLTWGNNASGQLGNGNTTPNQSMPDRYSGINNATAIAAGTAHSLVLRNDGSLWAWGDNTNGQLGYSTSNTQMTVPVQVKGPTGVGIMDNVSAFSGGNTHTMAVKNDGSVWLWGDGANGLLGDGATVKQNFPINTIRGLRTQGELWVTRYQESQGTPSAYPAIPFNLGSTSVDTNWNLPDGNYFLFVGIPATGGGFAWSVAKQLTIDTILPNSFTVSVNPSGWSKQPVLTFNTTDNDSGIDHYELTFDNGTVKTVTSPYTLPTQSDGSHDLKVTAVDRAGNRREAAAKVYIDTTPPEPFGITVTPSGWTNNQRPEIRFNAADQFSGIDHYELAIDGVGAQPVTSPFILPVLAEGVHTIKVTAVDKVGIPREATTTISIDLTKPEVSITSPASGATVSGTVFIQAAPTDTASGVDSVKFKIDNVYKETVSQAPYQYQFKSDIYLNGSHTIEVIVSDRAGNTQEKSIGITTNNQTISISGVLDKDQAWDGELILTGNVTVPFGKTLTILDGTSVTSVAGYALIIEGALNVQGVMGSEVTFSTSGAIWQGIQVKTTGTATITGATISGAKRGLAVTGGRATVTNCSFRENQIGLHVYGANSNVVVIDTIFNHNTYYGIKEDEGALPQVINCGFAANAADYYSIIDTELTMLELNSINNNRDNHQM